MLLLPSDITELGTVAATTLRVLPRVRRSASVPLNLESHCVLVDDLPIRPPELVVRRR